MPRGLPESFTCVGAQPTVAVGTHELPETYPAKSETTPLVEILRTIFAAASVKYTFPNGSTATLRKSAPEPESCTAVAWHPSPNASVVPTHVVFAVEELAPPAIVETVYGSATGAADTGTCGAGLIVIATGVPDVD